LQHILYLHEDFQHESDQFIQDRSSVVLRSGTYAMLLEALFILYIYVARDVHAQRAAHALHQLHLHRGWHHPKRRVVEHLHAPHKALHGVSKIVLQNALVWILHKRNIVEPNPVEWDSVSANEKPAEQEELG
jgi:hypothetical protein